MGTEDIEMKLAFKLVEAIEAAVRDGASPRDVCGALQAAFGCVLDNLGADACAETAEFFITGIQHTLRKVEAMKEEEDVEGSIH